MTQVSILNFLLSINLRKRLPDHLSSWFHLKVFPEIDFVFFAFFKILHYFGFLEFGNFSVLQDVSPHLVDVSSK